MNNWKCTPIFLEDGLKMVFFCVLTLSLFHFFFTCFNLSRAIGVKLFKRPGRGDGGKKNLWNIRKLLVLSVQTSEEIMRFGKAPSYVFVAYLFYQMSCPVSVF